MSNKLSDDVIRLLYEDTRRMNEAQAPFNPVTGEASIGQRVKVEIPDYPIPVQYLPIEMMDVPLVKQMIKAGSIAAFIRYDLKDDEGENADTESNEETYNAVVEQFMRVRFRYDFAFWAAVVVFIKRKGGGDDVQFRINRPQRKLVAWLENRRKAGKPIRLILLKARQWGGSTCIQMYFAWMQIVLKAGLNSLIVAHVKDASTEILDMFDRMLKQYPTELLHDIGEEVAQGEVKWKNVGNTGNIHRVPQRNCKIKIGTAEKPDTARGGDYNLVHLSEVGLWKRTEGKSPEDIVQAATSGIPLAPDTAIVYESTAKGVGNFFHREYEAAKQGLSLFEALFIAWFDIEMYALLFKDEDERADFAIKLWENRNNETANSDREVSGKYLWWLWKKGASLEAIHWYVSERRGKNDQAVMASEYPSDDIEAFSHSGARVFNMYDVEEFRPACKAPKFTGEFVGKAQKGTEALQELAFQHDKHGNLHLWAMPDIDPQEMVTERYLIVVDIGGRSTKADWTVIVVFDRLYMMDADKPVVVAQWRGHIDIDLLTWKAAQIAAFYDNSLLVIESNTADSRDPERHVEGGDQSLYLLNQLASVYPNMYRRKQSDEDIKLRKPVKYGFNTNQQTKPEIITCLIEVVREHEYIERDANCLDEYLTYELNLKGQYAAIIGKHDDLLMTRAIGMWVCFREMGIPKIVKRTQSKMPKRVAYSEASI